MLVKQDQISPCEVELQVEVDVEKVNAAIDETYKKLGKSVNVPGFRKGKAPRAILERYMDEEIIKEKAADKIMEAAYKEALEESKVEPYAPADVEVVKFELGEPMLFKAKIPLPPTVELGGYTKLKVERNVAKVTDEEVEREINGFLEKQASFDEITDRPAQDGDTAVIETKNNNEPDEAPKRNVTEVGKNLPDFDNGIRGMAIDEEKVIEVTYPDDFSAEELKGKTLPISTKLIELHVKKVPELTDEWVKTTIAGQAEEGAEWNEDIVDTVEKMRTKVREAMEKAAVDVADAEVRNKLIDMIVSSSTVNYPQVMVEMEVRERFEELIEQLKTRKVSFEDYLKYRNTTFEEMRKQYEEEAQKTLVTSLVLRDVIDKEKIGVEDADVDAEMQALADEQKVPIETIKAYLDRTNGLQDVRNKILQKKLLDFLINASNIKNVG